MASTSGPNPPPGPASSGSDDKRDSTDAEDQARQKGRLEGFIPDLVKRTFYAGLGALFTTEEGIRKIANDFQLPKDVANYLITQAASSKDELFRIVGREIRNALEHMDLSGEAKKLLTALSFEIKTEIRFIPNDSSVGIKPDIKNKIAVRRKDKDGKDRDGGDDT